MTFPMKRLVILGYGYVGAALAKRVRAQGIEVVASTRNPARFGELVQDGVIPCSVHDFARFLDADTALVVTFPPDGTSDAKLAARIEQVGAIVYVSSTGVYGHTRGIIDDRTPPSPESPRTQQRLDAEQSFRDHGATVLRVAAIYGPGRGMHERVRDGSARIAGEGTHHICRIHVDDLVSAILAALGLGRETYVIADDEPAQQGEVVRYLAGELGVPVPPAVPLESVSETLRNDRRVDASGFKARTGLRWAYPNYRVGFAACLRAESAHE